MTKKMTKNEFVFRLGFSGCIFQNYLSDLQIEVAYQAYESLPEGYTKEQGDALATKMADVLFDMRNAQKE